MSSARDIAIDALATFVEKADPLLDGLVLDVAPTGNEQEALRNRDEREYLGDLVERAKLIWFAYDRLCDLNDRRISIERSWRARVPEDENRCRGVDDQYASEREAFRVECDLLTTFLYYEISCVVDMYEALECPAVGRDSELWYLVSIRNRFLVHPQLHRVQRASRRGGSYPDGRGFPVHHVMSLDGLERDRGRVVGLGDLIDRYDRGDRAVWPAARLENERLIASRRFNEKLTPDEVQRLQTFGARDASTEKALLELGTLLRDQLLPLIERASDAAVNTFGYELWEAGPAITKTIFGSDEPTEE